MLSHYNSTELLMILIKMSMSVGYIRYDSWRVLKKASFFYFFYKSHLKHCEILQKMVWMFKKKDFILRDIPWTSHPVELTKFCLKLETDVVVEELAHKLIWSYLMLYHLQRFGKMPKLEECVTHDMTKTKCKARVDIYTSLHAHECILLFLNKWMTSNEKWIFYKTINWCWK